jgi:nitrous oxidase accessory protein NosD
VLVRGARAELEVTMIQLLGTRSSVVGAAFVAAATLALVAPRAAEASLLRVPDGFATVQAAVDAADAGDVIDVGPGSHCGATVDKPLTLVGHGRATIVGCADGPALSNGVRAGFRLPGTNGVSGASGTRIDGFVFDGRGISGDNLAPLGVAVIAAFADDVRVEHNVVLGTVQAITDTAGDRWPTTASRGSPSSTVPARCAAAATAS